MFHVISTLMYIYNSRSFGIVDYFCSVLQRTHNPMKTTSGRLTAAASASFHPPRQSVGLGVSWGAQVARLDKLHNSVLLHVNQASSWHTLAHM